jgi:hypothetical protein
LHAKAIAGLVGQVPAFGDDAVEIFSHLLEPFFGNRNLCCRRRQPGGFLPG